MFQSAAQRVRGPEVCAGLVVAVVSGCSGGVMESFSTADSGPVAASAMAEAPFLTARTQQLNIDSITEFDGRLDADHPIDVWDLGEVIAGERLVVDVSAGDGTDLAMGLFDGNYQVLLINHDRNPRKSTDPYGVLELRTDQPAVYLAVAADGDAAGSPYSVKVTHTSGVPLSPSAGQHVVLNFLGQARVSIGSAPAVDVEPFDATMLHPDWGTQTAAIRQTVMDHMVRIYSGLDVTFYFAEERPKDRPLTWVHFGGEHPSNVGLASNVDYGNRYPEQTAIVYVHNFAKYVKYGYTAEDIARGFANVAAHELGHLLGCNHSDDPADVMNVSPTVDALVAPQYFVPNAALDPRVFRAGLQDGAAVILAAVGGDWTLVENARRSSAAAYSQNVGGLRSLSAAEPLSWPTQCAHAQMGPPHRLSAAE